MLPVAAIEVCPKPGIGPTWRPSKRQRTAKNSLLSLTHVRVADGRVFDEATVEERAEHAGDVECHRRVGHGEVESLVFVDHGATYSGLTASIPPLRAAGCTVTTSQKFSGAMIGSNGGPHSR